MKYCQRGSATERMNSKKSLSIKLMATIFILKTIQFKITAWLSWFRTIIISTTYYTTWNHSYHMIIMKSYHFNSNIRNFLKNPSILGCEEDALHCLWCHKSLSTSSLQLPKHYSIFSKTPILPTSLDSSTMANIFLKFSR